MDKCALDLNALRNDAWKYDKTGLDYNICSCSGLVPSCNMPNKYKMMKLTILLLESDIIKPPSKEQ